MKVISNDIFKFSFLAVVSVCGCNHNNYTIEVDFTLHFYFLLYKKYYKLLIFTHLL